MFSLMDGVSTTNVDSFVIPKRFYPLEGIPASFDESLKYVKKSIPTL